MDIAIEFGTLKTVNLRGPGDKIFFTQIFFFKKFFFAKYFFTKFFFINFFSLIFISLNFFCKIFYQNFPKIFLGLKSFLVACYATLHPAMSVRRSVCQLVGPSVPILLFLCFCSFWLHCSCPNAPVTQILPRLG